MTAERGFPMHSWEIHEESSDSVRVLYSGFRYSTKEASGLFLTCMDVLGVQLRKYLKCMQKWMTGLDATDRRSQSCLRLGLTTFWCFIIVFRLVVRPIPVWSHSCSGHDLILIWLPSLNWIGPNYALWLEGKAWPPSFYTLPSTLLLCKMS